MHTGLLGHSSCQSGLLKGTTHTGGGDGCGGGVRVHPGASASRKQPDRIAMGEPVAAEQGEGAHGQRDIAVLEALAATNLELHAGTVDPADLEVDALADAEAAGVDGGEAGIVGRLLEVVQNAPDLVDAEDDGQGLCGTGTKQVEAWPGALEGILEEELEGGDGDRRGGAGEAALLVEGEKELAKLLIGDQIW